MCLLVAAWRVHTRYPLILAANRDEFHQRPTRPAHRWTDTPGVVGGRDLPAGGTWLAASRGRVAAVTNVRGHGPEPAQPRSRGTLPVAFVTGTGAPSRTAATVRAEAGDYAGFNLLLADTAELALVSNRAEGTAVLAPGVHAVGNSAPGEDWPKARRASAELRRVLFDGADDEALIAASFTLLSDETPAGDDELPDTGLDRDTERRLSPVFIRGDAYGTRCSTVVLMDADGNVLLCERGFGPDGRALGETRVELPA